MIKAMLAFIFYLFRSILLKGLKIEDFVIFSAIYCQ